MRGLVQSVFRGAGTNCFVKGAGTKCFVRGLVQTVCDALIECVKDDDRDACFLLWR